jgi:uncharacterized protein (TIGR03000 family)
VVPYGYESYPVAPAADYPQAPNPPTPIGLTHPDTLVHLTVKVPNDARVWIQGAEMDLSGPVREFVSPSLTPGSEYRYTVRATWSENGREVSRTRKVDVMPGDHVSVDFTAPQPMPISG